MLSSCSEEGLFTDMPVLQVATLMDEGVGINDNGI